MNIQRQIVAGLIFLFGIAVIVTGMSTYYTGKQAKEAELILKDNYNSVVYTKDMLKILSENDEAKGIDIPAFEKSLTLQQNNITEQGEKELTDEVTMEFNQLKHDKHSAEKKSSLNQAVIKVMEVNLKAIEEKSGVAINTAQTFFTYFIVTGVLFLILFVFIIVKLPQSEVKIED
jgi:hypothetical protein